MSDGQTSISRTGQPRAIAGQAADTGMKDDVAGFNLDVTSMPFGVGLMSDGSEHGALFPTGAPSNLKGINKWSANHTTGVNGDLDTVGLVVKATLELRRKGRIFVVVDPSLAVGALVPWSDRGFWRYSVNGGNTVVGAFTNVNDPGHTTDVTLKILFVSQVMLAADGVTKIAEVEANIS